MHRRRDAPFFEYRVVDHEVLFILFQAAASTSSPLPGPDVQDAWSQWNNTRIILTDARYPAINAFYLVRTSGN